VIHRPLLPAQLVTWALASALIAAAPRPAAAAPDRRSDIADNRRIVGVLEVRVEGVSDDVKQGFQRRLDEQLAGPRYWLASRARMKQLLLQSTTWIDGCVVGPCIIEAARRTGAELVLLASLTGSGTSFGFVVTLIRTDSGRVFSQRTERCDVCTVDEAVDKATKATISLLDRIPDRLPDDAAEQRAELDRAANPYRRELAEQHRATSRVGVALTAIGLAAAATGLALYSFNGQPSYAAITAAAGGAMAASGIVVLTF
jgi:hypothetical protein